MTDTQLLLVIGNKNYASWSLRAWLAARHAGVEFDEVMIPLFEPGYKERILAYSPAGKVPALRHGDLVVWDSLAICEYLAELCPSLWPQGSAARARARAVSAEMHAGFPALRSELPMNCRARGRQVELSAAACTDLERVQTLWRDCRAAAPSGPWLFGDYSIADAMYAPLVTRLVTYDTALEDTARAYVDTTLADPHLQHWLAAAEVEPHTIERVEVGA